MVSLFHLCFFLFVFCFTRSQNLSPRHNCPIFVWIMKSCLQERVWKWCPEFLKACKGFMFVCIPCSLFYCIFWYQNQSFKAIQRFEIKSSDPTFDTVFWKSLPPVSWPRRQSWVYIHGCISHENLEEESVSEANALSAAGFVTDVNVQINISVEHQLNWGCHFYS